MFGSLCGRNQLRRRIRRGGDGLRARWRRRRRRGRIHCRGWNHGGVLLVRDHLARNGFRNRSRLGRRQPAARLMRLARQGRRGWNIRDLRPPDQRSRIRRMRGRRGMRSSTWRRTRGRARRRIMYQVITKGHRQNNRQQNGPGSYALDHVVANRHTPPPWKSAAD